MKKFVLFFATAMLLATACNNKQEEKAPDPNLIKLQDMEEKYKDASSLNDSLMLLMSDIYNGLDAINTQEGLLMTPGIGDDANRREEIQQNLAAIKERLAANSALLADLQKKLKASGQENKVLTQTIDELKQRIENQESKIAELNEQLQNANDMIESLNTKVEEGEQLASELTRKVEETEAQNTALQNDLNTVYYVIADKKDLQNWGMLGKKNVPINYDKFVKADKTQLKSIPTGAKKIEIKSNMNAGSYEIVGDKNSPKTIRIIDPDAFWRNTDYLVVQIK